MDICLKQAQEREGLNFKTPAGTTDNTKDMNHSITVLAFRLLLQPLFKHSFFS